MVVIRGGFVPATLCAAGMVGPDDDQYGYDDGTWAPRVKCLPTAVRSSSWLLESSSTLIQDTRPRGRRRAEAPCGLTASVSGRSQASTPATVLRFTEADR